MILSLTQNSVQILNASHNANGHFAALSWSFGARIQCCAESFANFFDTGLKLVSLPLSLSMSGLVFVGSVLINRGPVSSYGMHPAAIRVLMQPLWRPRGRRATLQVAHLLVGPPIRTYVVGVGWGLVDTAWRLVGAGHM